MDKDKGRSWKTAGKGMTGERTYQDAGIESRGLKEEPREILSRYRGSPGVPSVVLLSTGTQNVHVLASSVDLTFAVLVPLISNIPASVPQWLPFCL